MDKNRIIIVSALTASFGLGGYLLLGGCWTIASSAIGACLGSMITERKVKENIPPTQMETSDSQNNNDIGTDLLNDKINKLEDKIKGILESKEIIAWDLKNERAKNDTLTSDFFNLLENVQSIIGYVDIHSFELPEDLRNRFSSYKKSLMNSDVSLEDYSSDNSSLFEIIKTSEIKSNKQVFPAILYKEELMIKGRIFIPA